jgi:hypothetical protein
VGNAGQDLALDRHAMGSPHSRSDRCQQRPCADDIHDARQIVGEYAERHLARDLRQRLHQEVRRAHPHFERTEGMLNCLASAAHGQPNFILAQNK